MKNGTKAAIAFVATEAFLASMFWIGGYNFDSRGFFVAYGYIGSIVIGALVAHVFLL